MTILTPTTLSQLASWPLLTTSWFFVAAATLSICNQPNEIPRIFEYAIANRPSDQQELTIARKMREALLKTSALGGLPKAINSLTLLKNVTPLELRESSPQRKFLESPDLVSETQGASFFNQVYGKVAKRIMGQLSSAYPDLAPYAINHVYGPLLSYTDILSPKETSLVVVACLIPQDVNPQLKGHLKGALNNGATKDEVDAVRAMSILLCNWSGITWKNEVAKL